MPCLDERPSPCGPALLARCRAFPPILRGAGGGGRAPFWGRGGGGGPRGGPGAPPPASKAARGNKVPGPPIGPRDGYGFVVPAAPPAGNALDFFVPAVGMASAMHGVRV